MASEVATQVQSADMRAQKRVMMVREESRPMRWRGYSSHQYEVVSQDEGIKC